MENQKHICHLTVMNPAIHSRIFFKEALSQVAAGYRVTIIGQDPSPHPYERQGVRILPVKPFKRLSWSRYTARNTIYHLALQEKADLYQIHSPELIDTAQRLWAAMPEHRFIYDVHEDYPENILNGEAYPSWLRGRLVRWIRKAEKTFSLFGHGVIYAEDCYQGLVQIDNAEVVRNKFQPFQTEVKPHFDLPGKPYMLYTGTIAREWGIMETMELWRNLNIRGSLCLVVAGHSHDAQLLQEMSDFAAEAGLSSQLMIYGGEEYLAHENIIALIQGCLFGTAFYEPLPHIRDKVPTKFYEFMAHQKPLLFSDNESWNELNQRFDFGLSVPLPINPKWASTFQQGLPELPCCQEPVPEQEWSWNYEKEILLGFIAKVLT